MTATTRLATCLLNYRQTPQSAINILPTELHFHCSVRTRLDLLRHSLENVVLTKQEKWKAVGKCDRKPWDIVTLLLARNHGEGSHSVPRVISDKRSPHSILGMSSNGVLYRHPDQLRKRDPYITPEMPTTNNDDDWPVPSAQEALEQLAVPPKNPQPEQLRRSLHVRRVRA